ncbi:MAG: S8 family serine peptidase [Actinomycetota bacterium]
MRMSRITSVFAVVTLLLLQAPAPVGAGPILGHLGAAIDVRMDHAADHVLVRLSEDVSVGSVSSISANAEPVYGRWYRTSVLPGETPMEAATRLAATPGIAVAELDYVVHLDPTEKVGLAGPSVPRATPNDPFYSFQWHFPPVQAPQAWDVSTGSGVVVAVVDTGISQGGEDLTCQTFVSPFNAITDTAGSAVDDEGHGTHVAGTIAQCTNNGVGVAGMAYGAQLMPVKVLGADGSGYDSDIAQGIDWARTNGAQVINLSLGSTCYAPYPACSSSMLDSAINAATSAGIVVVAASGNENSPYVGTPANNPNVISVGAVRYDLQRASYSNYGSGLDIVAPGGDELDQNNDGYLDGVLQETFGLGGWGYYYLTGTSMAAPHVTAAVAVLRAASPSATREQITAALLTTAADRGALGYDSFYGNGLLQVNNALTALATPSPVTITSFTPGSGPVGTVVVITGTSFTGATVVSFNLVPASFTVDSDTQITATVPVGATTGSVMVTTPAGTGISAMQFTVAEPAPQVTGTLKGFYGSMGRYKLYRVGRNVRYRGEVSPNLAGEELYFELQRLRPVGWRRLAVAHFTLGPASAAGVYVDGQELHEGVRYRIRCYVAPSGDRPGATSTWGYFMAKG